MEHLLHAIRKNICFVLLQCQTLILFAQLKSLPSIEVWHIHMPGRRRTFTLWVNSATSWACLRARALACTSSTESVFGLRTFKGLEQQDLFLYVCLMCRNLSSIVAETKHIVALLPLEFPWPASAGFSSKLGASEACGFQDLMLQSCLWSA